MKPSCAHRLFAGTASVYVDAMCADPFPIRRAVNDVGVGPMAGTDPQRRFVVIQVGTGARMSAEG